MIAFNLRNISFFFLDIVKIAINLYDINLFAGYIINTQSIELQANFINFNYSRLNGLNL